MNDPYPIGAVLSNILMFLGILATIGFGIFIYYSDKKDEEKKNANLENESVVAAQTMAAMRLFSFV